MKAKWMVGCDNGVLLCCTSVLYDGLRSTKIAVDEGATVWANGCGWLFCKDDWPRRVLKRKELSTMLQLGGCLIVINLKGNKVVGANAKLY